MPRNPSITLPAPSGADVTNDPMTTGLQTAQQVTNFVASRSGLLIGTPKLVPIHNASAAIDGIAYYYGQAVFSGFDIFGRAVVEKQADSAGDRILYIRSGALRSVAYANLYAGPAYGTPFSPQYLPQLQAAQTPTGSATFATGQTLRSAQFQTELILVQQGANSNYRYYIDTNSDSGSVPAGKVYTQGLETPVSPTIAYHTPGVGYVAKVGTVTYAVALIDEFGRYSSPSAAITGDFVTNPTKDALLSFVVTAPMAARFTLENVKQIAFLGTVQGAPDTFYVLQDPGTGTPAIQTYTGAGSYTYEDGVPDSIVQTGILGPATGQNDAPFASSIAVVWKNRMVQNNLYDPNNLQVSNEGSCTQFNTIPYDPQNPVPTNGVSLAVDQDNGNPITALVSFGTLLAIYKRRSIFVLYGEDASNFVIQPVFYGRGCVATDSAVRCEGFVFFLGEDGVYSWSGAEPTKISKPIESWLLSYNLTQAGAALYSAAKACYCNRQYILWIGQDVYVYNLDMEGWTFRAFGADANALTALTPASSINPFDPRNNVPNPALSPFDPDPSIGIPNPGPNEAPNGSPKNPPQGGGTPYPIPVPPGPPPPGP